MLTQALAQCRFGAVRERMGADPNKPGTVTTTGSVFAVFEKEIDTSRRPISGGRNGSKSTLAA
jgi:hypothetical protein